MALLVLSLIAVGMLIAYLMYNHQTKVLYRQTNLSTFRVRCALGNGLKGYDLVSINSKGVYELTRNVAVKYRRNPDGTEGLRYQSSVVMVSPEEVDDIRQTLAEFEWLSVLDEYAGHDRTHLLVIIEVEGVSRYLRFDALNEGLARRLCATLYGKILERNQEQINRNSVEVGLDSVRSRVMFEFSGKDWE